MRVLVSGAAGYIGGAVVRALAAAGHEPVAMVHHNRSTIPDWIEARPADLLSPHLLEDAVAGVEAVCHLGGLTRARESWGNALGYFQVNVTGTINLLDASAAAGVKRLVFASTGAIYGSPDTLSMGEDLPAAPSHPYAASKRAAELAVEWQARSGRLGASILRLFSSAGRLDMDETRIVPRTMAVALGVTDHLAVNGDGTAVRDLLHVDDVAGAFVSAVERCPQVGEIRVYNIGSGTGVSVMDVVAAAERVTGQAIPVEHLPPAAEPQRLIADPTRANTELGWKPTRSQLDDIVRDAWESVRRAGE